MNNFILHPIQEKIPFSLCNISLKDLKRFLYFEYFSNWSPFLSVAVSNLGIEKQRTISFHAQFALYKSYKKIEDLGLFSNIFFFVE